MTQTIPAQDKLFERQFNALPHEQQAQAYGVEYARFILDGGGELYLTRFGWCLSRMIMPQAWYAEKRYTKLGFRLPGSTGTVYRVPAVAPAGVTADLVVKISRFAQDVPLFVDTPVADIVPRDMVDAAQFNDPFEEFGLVMRLRRGPFGPHRPKVMTKVPLAIYSPPANYELWELGRHRWLFETHVQRLEEDQKLRPDLRPVTLNLLRDYIVVFQWVKGLDAEAFYLQGNLTAEEMSELYYRSIEDMALSGFVMLDHKPRHLILRQSVGTGQILRRHGRIQYVLIDFELLKQKV